MRCWDVETKNVYLCYVNLGFQKRERRVQTNWEVDDGRSEDAGGVMLQFSKRIFKAVFEMLKLMDGTIRKWVLLYLVSPCDIDLKINQ